MAESLAHELSALLTRTGGDPAVLRAVADAWEATGRPPTLRVVPFQPGRRPTDEDARPGMGSSDCAALVGAPAASSADAGAGNCAFVLFEADMPDDASVAASASLPDGWKSPPLAVEAIPGSHRRRVELDVARDLAGADLGFATGLLRTLRVDVAASRHGVPIAADAAALDVCDARLLGSLYQRIVERLVAPDTARQAAAAGAPDPGVAYHPWYPVLRIGMDKAALYTDALVSDIVGKADHLTDPAWLLRVGVYLELLTCLGVVEAVRGEPEVGDLLDPAERAAFDAGPVFAEVRARIDTAAWKEVWALRRIAFARRGLPRTGPVSARALLDKKKATLAFLHAHHEDLKHAIELAGPNSHNAQETWQRVFRDAERAVLRQTAAAFPELAFLPAPVREVVLWQRRGIGDQQGLYATACHQYRASMNMVAAWAKGRGLMDFTGDECVDLSTSLLHAAMHDPSRVPLLQRADGYGDELDVAEAVFSGAGPEPTLDEVEAMLAGVPILRLLDAGEIRTLAAAARPLLQGPHERFVVQGHEGTSLFIVADGDVEVVLRQGEVDVPIETMGTGAIIGEMGLLTGEPRAATVRAGRDGALVYEIGQQQYEPLVRAHPEWLDDLATEMADRLARRQNVLAARDVPSRADLRARIRRRFWG